jgi:hypothetical protein
MAAASVALPDSLSHLSPSMGLVLISQGAEAVRCMSIASFLRSFVSNGLPVLFSARVRGNVLWTARHCQGTLSKAVPSPDSGR